MFTVNIWEPNHTMFTLNELGKFVCMHADAYVDPPCCDGDSCACHGKPQVICPAEDCTGITKHEVNNLFEKIQRQ